MEHFIHKVIKKLPDMEMYINVRDWPQKQQLQSSHTCLLLQQSGGWSFPSSVAGVSNCGCICVVEVTGKTQRGVYVKYSEMSLTQI